MISAKPPHLVKHTHMVLNRSQLVSDPSTETSTSPNGTLTRSQRVRPRQSVSRPNLSPLPRTSFPRPTNVASAPSNLRSTPTNNSGSPIVRTRPPSSLRPNLSPLTSNPNSNLSPLTSNPNPSPDSSTLEPVTNSFARVPVPTPVNMAGRFYSQNMEPPRDASGNPLRNLARRFSPRGSPNLRVRTLGNPTNPTEVPLRMAGGMPLRRVSPTYSDNLPQSLFPNDMLDINELLTKLLASNPPYTPSPVLRHIRSLTPKLLRKGPPKTKLPRPTKPSLGSSPLSKPPINAQRPSLIDSAPDEVFDMIFSFLDSPQDLMTCSLTCRNWKGPAQCVLRRLVKQRPYVDLPMLQSLRLGLKNSCLTSLDSPGVYELIRVISLEYCQSNPILYRKLGPKSPETLVHTVFGMFLFVHRALHDPRYMVRNGSDTLRSFIRRMRGSIFHDLDKPTLKAIYCDIKAFPLMEETPSLSDHPSDLDDDPLSHPRRRWWQRIMNLGSQEELGGPPDDTLFRPLD